MEYKTEFSLKKPKKGTVTVVPSLEEEKKIKKHMVDHFQKSFKKLEDELFLNPGNDIIVVSKDEENVYCKVCGGKNIDCLCGA